MICKVCTSKYHFCSSCGRDGYSEYGYCSEECMQPEHTSAIKKLRTFYNSLDNEQRKVFGEFTSYPEDVQSFFTKYVI